MLDKKTTKSGASKIQLASPKKRKSLHLQHRLIAKFRSWWCFLFLSTNRLVKAATKLFSGVSFKQKKFRMGNTHVFSAPVLAYRPKMWSETWQQRNIALEPDSTLHVSHGAGGKASYTINLKLLSAENILFGRRQIRSLGASTSKPFPTDLYMDTTLNSLVDIDRAIIILDPSENAAQDGTDSSKSQKLHALAFTTQKDYFRFLVALTKMGLFRESLRDAMEHQPAHHAEHATAYEAAIKSSGGSNAFLKSISAGKGFSMSEMATVILVVLGFLWVLRYLLWTNEEDI